MTQLGDIPGESSVEAPVVESHGSIQDDPYSERIAAEQDILMTTFLHDLPLPAQIPRDEYGGPLPFVPMSVLRYRKVPTADQLVLDAYASLTDAVMHANLVPSVGDQEDAHIHYYRDHAVASAIESYDFNTDQTNKFIDIANVLLAGKVDPLQFIDNREKTDFMHHHYKTEREVLEQLRIRTEWVIQRIGHLGSSEGGQRPEHREIAWTLRSLCEIVVGQLTAENNAHWATDGDIEKLAGPDTDYPEFSDSFFDVAHRLSRTPKQLRNIICQGAYKMVQSGDYQSATLEK